MLKLFTQIEGLDLGDSPNEMVTNIEKTFSMSEEDTSPDIIFSLVYEQMGFYQSLFSKVDRVGVKLVDDAGKIIMAYGDFVEQKNKYVLPQTVEVVEIVPTPHNSTVGGINIIPPTQTPLIEKVASAVPKLNLDELSFNHEKVQSVDGSGTSAKRLITEASNGMVKAHLSRGDVIKFEVKRQTQNFKGVLPYNHGEVTPGYFYVNKMGYDEVDVETNEVKRNYILDGGGLLANDASSSVEVITEPELDSLMSNCDAWQVHSE